MFFTTGIGAGVGKAGHFWRPLQTISYALDYSLWKLNVRGYHLTNTLLHILVAVGIYLLTLILFKDNFISSVSALLFTVHPIHTEAVTYISGRADSLAGVFIFLSLMFYVRSIVSKRTLSYIFALVFYVLALASREGSMVVPALILLYHFSFRKRMNFKLILAFIGLTLGYLLLRVTLLKTLSSTNHGRLHC